MLYLCIPMCKLDKPHPFLQAQHMGFFFWISEISLSKEADKLVQYKNNLMQHANKSNSYTNIELFSP